MTIDEPSLQQPRLQDATIGNSEAVEWPPTPGEIDPDNPPWTENRSRGFTRAILLWLASAGFLLVVPLVLVLPYVFYRAAMGHVTPEELILDKTSIFLQVLGVIPAHLLTLLLVWRVVSQRGRDPFWKTLGFSWPTRVGPWTTVALCGGLAVGLLFVGGVITNWFGGQKTQLDQLIESSYPARLATAFLAVATAPLVEELIYRGVIYPAFARVVGAVGAVALVSIMFAGVHVWQYKNNLAVIGVITILSVALTLVRAYSHRLLPSFIIHLIFNGLQALYLIVQPLLDKTDHSTAPATPSITLLIRAIQHLM